MQTLFFTVYDADAQTDPHHKNTYRETGTQHWHSLRTQMKVQCTPSAGLMFGIFFFFYCYERKIICMAIAKQKVQ